jgi:hypothetical protein
MKKGKKLVLNKETLRDLMAHNTGEVKGGGKSKKCKGPTLPPTEYGVTCPTYGCTAYVGCTVTCYGCW